MATLAVLLGCTGGEPADDIEIVLWSVEPTMRIDGYEHDLVSVHSIAASDSGGLAISQVQTSSVLVFNPNGTLRDRVGRRGSGPGEFMFPHRVGWHADTLWIVDSQLRRFTFTSPEGELVRTSNIPRWAESGAADTTTPPRLARTIMPLSDGSFLAASSPYFTSGMADWVIRQSQVAIDGAPAGDVYSRVQADQDVVQVLARTTADRSVWSMELTSGGMAGGHYPFANPEVVRSDPQGEYLAVVRSHVDGEVVGILRVVLLRTSGDTIYDRRYPFAAQRIPSSAADSAIAAGEARWRDLGLPEVAAAFRRRAYIPEVFPPVTTVALGTSGEVWIGTRHEPESDLYMILDPAGELIGHVKVPANAVIHAVSDGSFWTVEFDPLEIPSVVRYAITDR